MLRHNAILLLEVNRLWACIHAHVHMEHYTCCHILFMFPLLIPVIVLLAVITLLHAHSIGLHERPTSFNVHM